MIDSMHFEIDSMPLRLISVRSTQVKILLLAEFYTNTDDR